MDQNMVPLLTPFNYYKWKSKVLIFLRSKSLFKISMGTELELTLIVENMKWFNWWDEGYGLLCPSVSPGLLFHIESKKSLNEIWTIMEGLFRK